MMIISSRSALRSALAIGSAIALVMACGSEDESKFGGEEGPPPSLVPEGGFGEGAPGIIDDSKDPPPKWCGGDAAPAPPPVTGTEQCPSDKNLPGCGCSKVGETAACWTDYRRYRNRGACKDGTTKCVGKNETKNVWGPCEGQTLPVPNGKGAEACSCFSEGEWRIANTSPCIANKGGYYAYAAQYDSNGQPTNCGPGKPIQPVGTAPTGPWSTNSLKVDCAGNFDLCYRIRVGDYKNPSASDCILGQVCTKANYVTAGVEQTLPDLASWAGTDAACAQKWEVDTPANVSPGYGEMVVKGLTVECDDVTGGAQGDYVFHRTQYCPRSCREAANANNQECLDCRLASSGKF